MSFFNYISLYLQNKKTHNECERKQEDSIIWFQQSEVCNSSVTRQEGTNELQNGFMNAGNEMSRNDESNGKPLNLTENTEKKPDYDSFCNKFQSFGFSNEHCHQNTGDLPTFNFNFKSEEKNELNNFNPENDVLDEYLELPLSSENEEYLFSLMASEISNSEIFYSPTDKQRSENCEEIFSELTLQSSTKFDCEQFKNNSRVSDVIFDILYPAVEKNNFSSKPTDEIIKEENVQQKNVEKKDVKHSLPDPTMTISDLNQHLEHMEIYSSLYDDEVVIKI
ncbi:hypothetical protein TNCT_576331 [Trichonephila clavata]|uniref:Uncharacterized protein n=1 Tax=Trichonephila clavata TaxID=2740835 RepID=A0A8X6KXR2_TRICU|nr:hypothetical protein TNCT_576331 [Trichonephila clavata]